MSEDNLFNEQLIELVKKNDAIWNTQHKDHRRSTHIDVLWIDIGVQLNKDPGVCKKRWRSLRDRFTRETKGTKGITGQAASTSCGWALFHLMKFLRPNSTPRPAITNYKPGTLLNLTNLELDDDFLNEEIIFQEDLSVDQWSPIITMTVPNDVTNMQPSVPSSERSVDGGDESAVHGVPTTTRQSIVEVNDEPRPSTSSKTRACKKKQSDIPPQSSSSTNVVEEAILRFVNQQTPTIQLLSADELWFLAIGKEVKDLPKKHRIRVKKAVMKALYDDNEDEEEE